MADSGMEPMPRRGVPGPQPCLGRWQIDVHINVQTQNIARSFSLPSPACLLPTVHPGAITSPGKRHTCIRPSMCCKRKRNSLDQATFFHSDWTVATQPHMQQGWTVCCDKIFSITIVKKSGATVALLSLRTRWDRNIDGRPTPCHWFVVCLSLDHCR